MGWIEQDKSNYCEVTRMKMHVLNEYMILFYGPNQKPVGKKWNAKSEFKAMPWFWKTSLAASTKLWATSSSVPFCLSELCPLLCVRVCVFRIPICTYNPLFCSLMLIALPKFCKCEMLRHARRVEHLLSRLASRPPVCLPVCTPPRETGIRGLGGLTVWMAYE